MWWAFNTHIHTIVASQFIKAEKPEHQRVEIPTPDNDFLEIDVCRAEDDKPVVALFHGLEGSTERHYIASLMWNLKRIGYSSVAMNFRGCGDKMNALPRFYHSGETQDYRTLFKWIKEHFPDQEIYAAGFSLGGNALVKYLAEEGGQSPVSRAVVISPPYDLKGGAVQLHLGFNRIYEVNFLKTLVKKLEQKRERIPELPRYTGDSIYDFDDQVTAQLHEFKDAEDYYYQCSSRHFFGDVKTDLLIIHSKVDALCPIEFAPLKVIRDNPFIETIFTEQGGHVGFLSKEPGWLNRVIMKWFKADT